jgi:FMN phosphatase YigB (HAD superfamily)/glycosyltransferase involved in cell wall biosynthesis
MNRQSMRIAIVHYHLGQGGVARVIEKSSRILSQEGISHVILTGDSGGVEFPVRQVAGLGYGDETSQTEIEVALSDLRRIATDALGGPPDLWHFHNHSLGKNRVMSELVMRLAEERACLLLQLHDLAEDGRAENYPRLGSGEKLYPIAPRIHYAFLNSQDLARFVSAGLPRGNASVLDNPIQVESIECVGARASGTALLFAPVRGIRRKNLGELVLFAALAPPGVRLATSRAPTNPEAIPTYDRWREIARRHALPIEFGVVDDRLVPVVGAAVGFESWLSHATHIITTSVAEGFGLPFLESIAHGKPLIGRNLPHLTADHAASGIDHSELYDRILIPVEWVGEDRLRAYITLTLQRDFQKYRRVLESDFVSATLDALLLGGAIDFGNLPELIQQEIVEKCLDPACHGHVKVEVRGEMQVACDWLARVIEVRHVAQSQLQLAPYAAEKIGETLMGRYATLIGQAEADVDYLRPENVLSVYLKPETFHFLKSAPLRHRAVIFDIYGTLLHAVAGGVKPDFTVDAKLIEVLRAHGHAAPESPSSALHARVLAHHARAGVAFPEVDLRVLWREVLNLNERVDTHALVRACEEVWHPAKPMPGAGEFVRQLAACGIPLGLLSNAQCNTLAALGDLADLFATDLSVFSYQEGLAKPSPELFEKLRDRLLARGIKAGETLFVGNDPCQDVIPAAAAGYRTALFVGHPASLRPGDCKPDVIFRSWTELCQIL